MKLSKNVVKYSPLVISSLISYFMDYDTKFIDNLKKPSLYPPGTLFGQISAVDDLAIMLHKAGGYIFLDYATAAPYVHIDMNPTTIGPNAGMCYKDAIYFSGHKFPGPGGLALLMCTFSLFRVTRENGFRPKDVRPNW